MENENKPLDSDANVSVDLGNEGHLGVDLADIENVDRVAVGRESLRKGSKGGGLFHFSGQNSESVDHKEDRLVNLLRSAIS